MGLFFRTMVTVFACSLVSVAAEAMVTTSPESMSTQRLEELVGTPISGWCCKPGRRWGCDATFWPNGQFCQVAQACPGAFHIMPCDDCGCNGTDSVYDTCYSSVQAVGLNICLTTGNSIVCDSFLNTIKCEHTLLSRWDDPQGDKLTASVCGSCTICTYSYSVCEGS